MLSSLTNRVLTLVNTVSPKSVEWGIPGVTWLSLVAHESSGWAFFLSGLAVFARSQGPVHPPGFRLEGTGSSLRFLDLRWCLLKLNFLNSVCQISQSKDAPLWWGKKLWESWFRFSFTCHHTWTTVVINPIFSPLHLKKTIYVLVFCESFQSTRWFFLLFLLLCETNSFVQDESFCGGKEPGVCGIVTFAFAYMQN